MPVFKFLTTLENIPNNDNYLIIVSNVKNKEELFNTLYKELKFPNYFGFNWDALYDCLNDLSWIIESYVTIVHDDSFKLDHTSLKVYIDILSSVSKKWEDDKEHIFNAIFSLSQKKDIEAIV